MKSRLWSVLLFLCVVATGIVTIGYFWTHPGDEEALLHTSPAEDVIPSGTVRLPAEKAAAAGIHTVPVGKRSLKRARTVPGRIQYDDTRHIAVKAATAGALIDVKVKPGDPVSTGQVLAVLSSPEVGTARSEVIQRGGELKLVQAEREWLQQSSDGMKTLVEAIQKKQSIETIQVSLQKKLLGKSRDTIITAYSRFLLADSLSKGLASAGTSGAVSGRLIAERQNERESAEASLQAVQEQALFDSKQDLNRSGNAVELAQNKLKISQQHLTTLLGYDEATITDKPNAVPENLSLVEVRAPFAGTIEKRLFANSERVQLGDTLFILADTTRLWVAADLREGEWAAMGMQANDSVIVTTPAISGREFDASVYYIGREVAPETNSVPLVATINNSDGHLRPGLFVRVQLPLGESREVLAVPESAISEHESKSFVFVQAGERTYRRVGIQRGTQEGEWVEVTSGLSGGENVVDQGAFVLKSELLLEREE